MERFAKKELSKNQTTLMLSLIGVSAALISYNYFQIKNNNKQTITLLQSIAKI